MRIDKYLKVSRLIKRRTVAKEACTQGRILINGKPAKPGSEVSVGDLLELAFGNSVTKVKIQGIKEHVLKDEATTLYEIIE